MKKKKLLITICLLGLMISFLASSIVNPFVLGAIGQFQVVKTIMLDDNVKSLAVNEELNRLYVGTENGLLIFDSQTDTKITEILPGNEISALALNPQTNRLYVVEWGEKIIVIDCTTNQQVGEIAENIYDQREIAINPVTNRVYISQWHTFRGDYCCVRVYNGDTLAFITQVNICTGDHTYVERVGVAVNPETNIIYATWSGDDSIYIIDGNTHDIKEVVTPSSFSVEISFTPHTNRIYIGNVVLDCENFEEVTSNYSGRFMTVDTVNNILYTSGYSELFILNATTHGTIVSLEITEDGYFYPDSAAVNSKIGKFYAAYSGDSKIPVVMQVQPEPEPTEPEPTPPEPTTPEPTEPEPTPPEPTTPEPTEPEPTEPQTTTLAPTYTSEEHNFSIDPPSGWTIDDTNTAGAVYFYGPTEEGFRVNINIIVESLPPTMTLEQYKSANKESLSTGLDNYEFVSESTRAINKVEAYEMVSTFSYSNVLIKNKQVLLVNANNAYIITYTAQPTTYQKYLLPFESSIETFKFIEPTTTETEPTTAEPTDIQEPVQAFNITTEMLLVIVTVVAAVIALVAYKLGKRKART